jgi:hypothetical protein
MSYRVILAYLRKLGGKEADSVPRRRVAPRRQHNRCGAYPKAELGIANRGSGQCLRSAASARFSSRLPKRRRTDRGPRLTLLTVETVQMHPNALAAHRQY